MYIKNKSLSVAFKLAAFAAGTVGILLQCGVFSGRLDLSVFNYFTMMSNVLCAVYFLTASVSILRGRRSLMAGMKGALVLCIAVTGLVYNLMLAGRFNMQGTLFWSNTLLHCVVPVMTVLDWLLFDEKGRYTKYAPFQWCVFPVLYFVYVMVRVQLGGVLGPYGSRYPYYFMDVDLLGLGPVMLIGLVMILCFLALGYGILWLDRKMARMAAKK